MKKILVTVLLLLFITFGTGCSITIHNNLYIEQAEPYFCEIGDLLPFKGIEFNEETEVLKNTGFGVYAFTPGDILVKTEQGYYHIIVQEPSVTINYTTEQLLNVGDETEILVSISPLENDQTVTFESMDESVIEVSETGKVLAIKEGLTRVRVRSNKYNIESDITFLVLAEDEKYYEDFKKASKELA